MTLAVRTVGIRKSFGAQEVLKGIDLAVDYGEVLCILGPSGSGKSTLLRCINHLEVPDGGYAWVDGQIIGYALKGGALHELPVKRLRAQQAQLGRRQVQHAGTGTRPRDAKLFVPNLYRRDKLEVAVPAKENCNAIFVFRGQQGAGRINEPAAALYQRCGPGQD
mgnify:CR=1 FL=1